MLLSKSKDKYSVFGDARGKVGFAPKQQCLRYYDILRYSFNVKFAFWSCQPDLLGYLFTVKLFLPTFKLRRYGLKYFEIVNNTVILNYQNEFTYSNLSYSLSCFSIKHYFTT